MNKTGRSALIGALLGTLFAVASTRADHTCADKSCDSPEQCTMRNTMLQKTALAAVFGDKKLMTSFMTAVAKHKGGDPKSAVTNGDAKTALIAALGDELNDWGSNSGSGAGGHNEDLPTCGGAGLDDDVSMHTNELCDTYASFQSLGVKTGMGGAATKQYKQVQLSPDGKEAHRAQTCQEIVDAAYKHEQHHKAECKTAQKNHKIYSSGPPMFADYVAEDAASYRVEIQALTASLKAAHTLKCSPTKKQRNRAKNYLKNYVRDLVTAYNNASAKGGK